MLVSAPFAPIHSPCLVWPSSLCVPSTGLHLIFVCVVSFDANGSQTVNVVVARNAVGKGKSCVLNSCFRWNVSMKGKESSEYAPHRSTYYHSYAISTDLGPRTWKEKQGATTACLKTGWKSTRAQRKMKQRGPPRHCENCVRKARWSRRSHICSRQWLRLEWFCKIQILLSICFCFPSS